MISVRLRTAWTQTSSRQRVAEIRFEDKLEQTVSTLTRSREMNQLGEGSPGNAMLTFEA
jgi:hypothetical protein